MKYQVSPVVRIAVEVKHLTDLPKLVDGLKKLAKSDPLVQCYTEESGEHIIAGCGELHLDICYKDLVEEYAKCELIRQNPIITYKETIQEESKQICLAKSPNKHNRIFSNAMPLGEALSTMIESEDLGPKTDKKERSKVLVEQFEWHKADTLKLWCFGPDQSGPNMLVDVTKGTEYLNEVRDTIEVAFQWAAKEGPMCEENMRGVRFNLQDVKIHSDSRHRMGEQIVPAARRSFLASVLTSTPALQEPVFLCDIQTVDDIVGSIYQTISQRRGYVIAEEPVTGSPLVQIKAYLPVAESFGFTEALRAATSGKAFPQCVFDHWEVINSNPLEPGTKANEIVESIRKRKGLNPGVPPLDRFLDRL